MSGLKGSETTTKVKYKNELNSQYMMTGLDRRDLDVFLGMWKLTWD